MNKVIINLKTRYKRMFMPVVAILLIALATSCGKKNDTEEDNSNKEINEWILEMMKVYYLWNTHIPGKTDQTLSPDEYFESLLYRPSDRFSWIQDNFVELLNSLSGVNTEAGYDYNLLRMSENNSNVIGYITYIKPGTPAVSAGLKRGDFFHEINGIQMDLDNYSSLLKQTLK
ncbi:MAG: hypothetical protein LBH60_07430, partial [Prevotellaceae bacterium]|nr:hypothetical protein [Prevotellaceae bacterium]